MSMTYNGLKYVTFCIIWGVFGPTIDTKTDTQKLPRFPGRNRAWSGSPATPGGC